MKTSNWIVSVLCVAAAVFFIWLWASLGFYEVSGPVDVVLSVLLIALAAGSCFAISRTESKRRRSVRTVFIASDQLFNSEAGSVAFDGRSAADCAKQVLQSLRYSFSQHDLPQNGEGALSVAYRFVVRSDDFQAGAQADSDAAVWKGSVAVLSESEPRTVAFENEAELRSILQGVS